MAQAGVRFRVAGAFDRLRMQGQEMRRSPGYSRRISASMRLSSKNSIARRCIGLKLSANIGWLQRR
jgi:hypothetical protein